MPRPRSLALPLSILMTIGLLVGVVTPAAAAPTALSAVLTGAEEVPDPPGGDTDGTGTATVTVDPAAGTLCYTIVVVDVAAATGAHIHEAPPGVAGPIKVSLTLPDNSGNASDCAAPGDYNAAELPNAAAVSAFLADLAANPQKYYVNVHTAPFPDGAVRGQLNNPRLCGPVVRDASTGVISIGGTVVPSSAVTAAVMAQLAAAASAAASVCLDATYNASGEVVTAVNLDATFTLCATVAATGSGATRAFTVGGFSIPAAQLSTSEAATLELALLNGVIACANLVIVDSVVTDVSGHVVACVTVGAVTSTSVTLDGIAIPFGSGSTIGTQIQQGATLAVRVEVNGAAVTFSATTLAGCTPVAPPASALPDTSVDAGAPVSALLTGLGTLQLLGALALTARRRRRAA